MSSLWRLPPLAGILDPRPEREAQRSPIANAANIPFDQLSERTSELPPRDRTIHLADFRAGSSSESAFLAADFLDRGGRRFAWQVPAIAEVFTSGRLWEPNELLQAAAQLATGTRALDLGCGAGRDAVALASAGFDVVGLDVLPDAVDRMLGLYERWKGPGWGRLQGLRRDWARQTGQFDLVIAFAAFSADLPDAALRCLAPDGVFAVSAFTTLDAESQGVPARSHHVAPDELQKRFSALLPIHAEAFWDGGRHRATFIGRLG
ncbi:MAG: hypothetical protein HONBIEJF_02247 [Fimbriimonadaceae bacterium]|nr:hypothetical protein [Fimbriimonadaceae bacterium]